MLKIRFFASIAFLFIIPYASANSNKTVKRYLPIFSNVFFKVKDTVPKAKDSTIFDHPNKGTSPDSPKVKTSPPDTNLPDISSKLSALLNFNFLGNNSGISNLTPAVFYGWTMSNNVTRKNKDPKAIPGSRYKVFTNDFQTGPYIGSSISIKDSSSYLPALMLPGNAGIEINDYLTFFNENKVSLVFSPLNLGAKVISGFTDTSLSLIQYNIRQFIGVKFMDKFAVSFLFTTGWNNATSNSAANFTKIFGVSDSKVQYWNLTLAYRINTENAPHPTTSSVPVYIYVSLRGMTSPKNNFNLPNYRFITAGIMADLNLKSGAYPGNLPMASQAMF